jgi:hypothetical protein
MDTEELLNRKFECSDQKFVVFPGHASDSRIDYNTSGSISGPSFIKQQQQNRGGYDDNRKKRSSVTVPPENDNNKLREEIRALEDIKNEFMGHTATSDPEKTHTGGVDSTMKFKVYFRWVLVSVIIVESLFIFVTIFQLIFPTFTLFSGIPILTLAVSLAGGLFLFQTLVVAGSDSFLAQIVKWGLWGLVFGLLCIALWIISTELSWITMLIVHIIEIVAIGVPTVLVYHYRKKLQGLRKLVTWGNDFITVLLVVTVLAQIKGMMASMGSFALIIVAIVMVFRYTLTISEVAEGINGMYDTFTVINVLPDLANSIFVTYMCLCGFPNALKEAGLDFYLFEIPASWFGFL